jgi:hypothetical protein
MEFRSFVSKSDRPYRLLISVISLVRPRQQEALVSNKTDLVIEGFARSANTYVLSYVELAVDNGLLIASHLHESYQVRFAEKYGLPCIVLFREPKDAVVSAVLRTRRVSIASLLRNYIRFYEDVLRVRRRAVLVPFDVAVSNGNRVIEQINVTYNLELPLLADERRSEVMLEVERKDRKAFEGERLNPVRVAQPTKEKEAEKEKVGRLVEDKYGDLLQKARVLHAEMSKSHSFR